MKFISILAILSPIWWMVAEGSQNSTDAGNADAVTLLLIQLSQDMKDVKQDVSGIKQDVSTLQQDMHYVQEDVSEFQEGLDTLDSKTSVLQKITAGFYTELTDLQLKDQELEKDISDGAANQQSKDLQQDGEISNLKNVVSDNYNEISAELDEMHSSGHTVEGTIDAQCSVLNALDHVYYYTNNSRYDVSYLSYSGDEARLYCLSRGGDLAYSEMGDMEKRQEIATGLNLYSSSSSTYQFLFGLRLFDVWLYPNNNFVPTEEAIHWYTNEPGAQDDCAAFQVYEDGVNHLLTYGVDCDSDRHYAICEYKCSD